MQFFSFVSKNIMLPLMALSFLAPIFTAPKNSFAKTMYVKPMQELAVRRGQGLKYKIIAMVEAGTAVEVLEQTDGYARIRLNSGKEGWLLTRFLDNNIPAEQILEKTLQENSQLKEQTKDAVKKAAEATASLEEAQEQLNRVLLERNSLLENYQQLQKDTADVIQLKTNQEETAQLNAELSKQVISLKDENIVLKKEKNLDWFITGAAVLALGLLLGKIPPPRRKKKGYLVQ